MYFSVLLIQFLTLLAVFLTFSTSCNATNSLRTQETHDHISTARSDAISSIHEDEYESIQNEMDVGDATSEDKSRIKILSKIRIREALTGGNSRPVNNAFLPKSNCIGTEDLSFIGGGVMRGTVELINIYLPLKSSQYNSLAVSIGRYIVGFAKSECANIYGYYTDRFGHANVTMLLKSDAYLPAETVIQWQPKQLVDYALKYYTKQSSFVYSMNGIYIFIFDGSIPVPGWLTEWCALSGEYVSDSWGTLRFAFIGDTSTLDPITASGCAPLFNGEATNPNITFTGASAICSATSLTDCSFKSPNNDGSVDSILSHYTHIIGNTLTGSAWIRECDGSKMADICAWNYGNISYNAASDSHYNVVFGGREYLIQSSWRLKKDKYNVSECTLAAAAYSSGETISIPSLTVGFISTISFFFSFCCCLAM